MAASGTSASQSRTPSTRRAAWRGVAATRFAVRVLLALAAAGAGGAVAAQEAPPRDVLDAVVALVDDGRFAQADARIASALADEAIDARTRTALDFQRERMRRIRMDFPHDAATVRAQLADAMPDATDAEFDAWTRSDALEHLVIDGEPRYFARAVPNLFRIRPALKARRANPPAGSDGPMESLNAHHAEVRDAARRSGRASVAPRRVEVTQMLTVDAGAVPDGEMVRAWIPYPRAIAGQQENIVLLDTDPKPRIVAPESALQRTVYMERVARDGRPTEFSVRYALDVYAQFHDIDPARVERIVVTDELREYVAERPPQIVFSDALREFSARAVGDETNPYRVAQKLFAAVDRTPWASAREYSTITSIPEYVLRTGHGDCGQQTLLLIALLRLNGIPARWQSGMVYSDGDYDNLHDWGQLYLPPYGWVPMDVTTGALASSDASLAWFYLGGQDAYRIAFNDDFSRDFVPPKRHHRSETVDSQRGEVEWRGGNLYYDQWDYSFSARAVVLDDNYDSAP